MTFSENQNVRLEGPKCAKRFPSKLSKTEAHGHKCKDFITKKHQCKMQNIVKTTVNEYNLKDCAVWNVSDVCFIFTLSTDVYFHSRSRALCCHALRNQYMAIISLKNQIKPKFSFFFLHFQRIVVVIKIEQDH